MTNPSPNLNRENLNLILLDKDLAKLGDSFINFIYSLALTFIHEKPSGVKVCDKVLVEAAKKANIRNILPKRTPKGRIADAVEALLIHSAIKREVSLERMLELLVDAENASDGFARIIEETLRMMKTQ